MRSLRIWREIAGLGGERIVLLSWDNEPPNFCNLMKITADGTEVWVAQPSHPLEGIWTDVEFKDGILRAYNFAGFSDVIDYGSGRILNRSFVK